MEEADVIPFQVSGSISTDDSTNADELMTWALANLWKDDQEGGYLIRHSRCPVIDFGKSRSGPRPMNDSNFFEKAYPCLFPYGRGGLEANRQVYVSLNEHVQWSLQYNDTRFRRHETYPFLVFGIQQRRQALQAARLQMNQRNFALDAKTLDTITGEKLENAKRQETEKKPIDDPAIRLLRQHVYAAGGKVMGTNQSRWRWRSRIWSTSMYLGPPTLWMTINPCDLHDPIAQVFAGEKINLDEFEAVFAPDREKRAENIAIDAYAAAKFFHFTIDTILKTLFKVTGSNKQFTSETGVYGSVQAYFGVNESQQRGTLHHHILIWFKNTPNADEMRELLKTEQFRDRILGFIRQNVRADAPGLGSREEVKKIPNETDIAFGRPPNPNSENYEKELEAFEIRVARNKQIHTCEFRRCLRLDKHGVYRCKRRAPFKLSSVDYVHSNGDWAPRRLNPYLNNWSPAITICGRCNNDIKILTNGEDTKNTTYYITSYAAKSQGDSPDLSAITADKYAYHVDHNPYIGNIRDSHRLLIFRILDGINREQQISAPMVMSYLMGWGDTKQSHHYVPIYWSTFHSYLLRQFPILSQSNNTR
jgi:hypothetical protein